jgi:hypothetical protein
MASMLRGSTPPSSRISLTSFLTDVPSASLDTLLNSRREMLRASTHAEVEEKLAAGRMGDEEGVSWAGCEEWEIWDGRGYEF